LFFKEPEKKLDSKLHTSVYLRHWRPDEYCLGDLFEIVLNGNSFEILIDQVTEKKTQLDSGLLNKINWF